MGNADQRPNPDALLEIVKAAENHRGHLKIFFGGCAGVGKTYAMLHAAHEKRAEGVDVMIGVVEAHGREDTVRMLAALPVIPQKEIIHRGITVNEFDLDATLARKPGLLLLDELAHTNAPGSRHPKRWQDVEELLDAGIDVYTTVNVQHLESLNDLVASVTGVTVRETVPDAIFDEADDITLVDIPPDELLKRLKEGKVYLGADVRANAAENFFKKSNLSALRELALRRTAERVDAQMEDTRILEGIRDAAAVADKIIVCVGPEPLSARLVRSAKRLARGLKAPWVAVYVENQRHYNLNERGKRAVETVLRMAERIGGKAVVLQGDNAVEEIMSYARANGFSKVLVGKPARSRWQDIMKGSLVGDLIRASGDDIDVYVITGKSYFRGEITQKPDPLRLHFQQYGLALAAVALATLTGWGLDAFLQPIDQEMKSISFHDP